MRSARSGLHQEIHSRSRWCLNAANDARIMRVLILAGSEAADSDRFGCTPRHDQGRFLVTGDECARFALVLAFRAAFWFNLGMKAILQNGFHGRPPVPVEMRFFITLGVMQDKGGYFDV